MSVIRYRVLPLKSWPVVGIVNVPLFTPVTGCPGWTCPSWRKSMFQVNALAGSAPSSVSVALPLKVITSPATEEAAVGRGEDRGRRRAADADRHRGGERRVDAVGDRQPAVYVPGLGVGVGRVGRGRRAAVAEVQE